jgi:hypothetical protein
MPDLTIFPNSCGRMHKPVNLLIVTLALLLLSGCVVVHRTDTVQRSRSGEELDVFFFENQSVRDSFLSHLKDKKIQGRNCAETSVLFFGFISEMTVPSESSWINDYQSKVDMNKDRGVKLGFFIPFLFMHMHNVEYSQNALFNDHVKRCDSNGDKIITCDEAKAYSEIAKVE